MAADRDPNREMEPLCNTAPVEKIAQKVNDKHHHGDGSEDKKQLNVDGKTGLEAYAEDEAMDGIKSLDPAHHKGFEYNNNSVQTAVDSPESMEGIDVEERNRHAFLDKDLTEG
ncbi:LOW QUALITY PROTEIN: Hypothetical protein PHPALM_36213 [Phytophthora palmivora]|uniref:Uncharacterized protein n=1 Tax=Phytophthora palmivora TaxID=4796 RepID=A0A2P4X0J4_9STRA|nr:LOW QUALITY PROTEIN: Hypothetical protein PHPALM_36213 [Phytophthora palmivora]